MCEDEYVYVLRMWSEIVSLCMCSDVSKDVEFFQIRSMVSYLKICMSQVATSYVRCVVYVGIYEVTGNENVVVCLEMLSRSRRPL